MPEPKLRHRRVITRTCRVGRWRAGATTSPYEGASPGQAAGRRPAMPARDRRLAPTDAAALRALRAGLAGAMDVVARECRREGVVPVARLSAAEADALAVVASDVRAKWVAAGVVAPAAFTEADPSVAPAGSLAFQVAGAAPDDVVYALADAMTPRQPECIDPTIGLPMGTTAASRGSGCSPGMPPPAACRPTGWRRSSARREVRRRRPPAPRHPMPAPGPPRRAT